MKRNIKKIIASMLTSAMALGGANIAFAVNLPAPDVAEGYTRYEAEDAELINGANVANFKLENQAGQSNDINTEGNVVGGFKSLSSAESLNYDFSNTTSVRFTVERQAEGMVTVILGYRSSQEVNMEQRCGNIPIKCNDGTVKELEVGVDPTADKPKKQVSVDVDMKVGTNTIYVAGPIKGSGWINIDYIDVANYTDTENRVEPEEKEADDMGINPPIKTIYTADPSAHVWKTDPDKLYVYPSHDRYPQQGCNRMDAFHIYSTKNMVDYTDEGEIFSAYDLEWGREAFDKDGKFDDGTFMWAPDAAYSEKTGKYYFYYPRPASRAFNDEWMVGVAVSDYPDHGFVDVGVPIIGIGGRGMIDPCVFTDDDGRSYIYLAGGGTWMNGCAVAELNDDMVTLKEVPKVMIVEGIPEEWDENGVYIGKDENGNPITQDGVDISTLYASGNKLTTKKKGADYYVSLAEKMIDNMKSQLLKKAKAMCDANGVTFDNKVFDTMFNNAKSVAINKGVTGVNAKGASVSFGGIAGGTGAGVAGGVAHAAITVAAAKAGGLAGSFGGPVGIAIGAGIGAIVGGIASLFGSGNHSSCTLDTKTLLDTLTNEFKTNYTAWVEAEAAEAKNKK